VANQAEIKRDDLDKVITEAIELLRGASDIKQKMED